jgi:hypothetical protein
MKICIIQGAAIDQRHTDDKIQNNKKRGKGKKTGR